ncbi:MAG TPA: magnesium transporter CorA family protein [Candidatus Wallbacteria bacterium]|nr:magnesium transporter CorA family protein [Candidatus Wallbacteria bacterium]
MSVSHFIHVNRGGKFVRIDKLSEALEAVKKGGFLWLNYFQPTKEELMQLSEPLQIHPLTIEDCTDENQIPKMDDFPKNTFILFNAFNYADRKLTVEEIDLIIGENYLVTVSGVGADSSKLMDGIEKMVEFNNESAKSGPAFLMHVILDYIVDKKFDTIETLEEELDRAEESMLEDITLFNPADLMHLRRNLIALRKSLFHEREIMVKICRKDCPFVSDKAIFNYRDIYDHLAKFFELTETYRDIVTSLMEMYLSMVNNQMARISNETNISVRRLTLITTIFMPLTLFAGIGGMSEWSMMTGPENWKISYPAFLLVMALLGVVNYYYLRWLERNDGKQALSSSMKKDGRKNPAF